MSHLICTWPYCENEKKREREKVRGGGGGGQGGMCTKNGIIVKKGKEKSRGGGGGRWIWRSEAIVKIQKKNIFLFFGRGGGWM